MPKIISIIIPVYNEEKNIPLLYAELEKEFNALKSKYSHEIIFVNDGSTDNSQAVIEKLSERPEVKFIEFSRNFGKELATTAGIKEAQGDAVIMIDADLQHPISLIPKFLEKWEGGGEVVVGVRDRNTGEGFVKRFGSKVFYFILKRISETDITTNATDFRLLDRRVIDEFNKLSEHGRLTRGLIDWLGFKREYIPFIADQRKNGIAAYGTFKLMQLFFSSFISHSMLPLRFAGYLGVGIILISGPLGIFIFFEKYFAPVSVYSFTGRAALAVIILFLIGIVLACLGLIALYIGNIHVEVTARPLYVVRSRKGGKVQVRDR